MCLQNKNQQKSSIFFFFTFHQKNKTKKSDKSNEIIYDMIPKLEFSFCETTDNNHQPDEWRSTIPIRRKKTKGERSLPPHLLQDQLFESILEIETDNNNKKQDEKKDANTRVSVPMRFRLSIPVDLSTTNLFRAKMSMRNKVAPGVKQQKKENDNDDDENEPKEVEEDDEEVAAQALYAFYNQQNEQEQVQVQEEKEKTDTTTADNNKIKNTEKFIRSLNRHTRFHEVFAQREWWKWASVSDVEDLVKSKLCVEQTFSLRLEVTVSQTKRVSEKSTTAAAVSKNKQVKKKDDERSSKVQEEIGGTRRSREEENNELTSASSSSSSSRQVVVVPRTRQDKFLVPLTLASVHRTQPALTPTMLVFEGEFLPPLLQSHMHSPLHISAIVHSVLENFSRHDIILSHSTSEDKTTAAASDAKEKKETKNNNDKTKKSKTSKNKNDETDTDEILFNTNPESEMKEILMKELYPTILRFIREEIEVTLGARKFGASGNHFYYYSGKKKNRNDTSRTNKQQLDDEAVVTFVMPPLDFSIKREEKEEEEEENK